MINKLWTGVSLENYNNWYPLTGKITETPPQYINTWPNVNDWFKTFAIRAQNDINAYLGFILSKFPFDSFKDELIKETLRDMVYVTAEHWVFNRTPIEFNVDATIQFNNGSQFSASSIPTINIWDLAPSRMKILARLTELKQILSSYNDDEIDVEKIDLKAFYTRNQVDELFEQQKEFTLSKQIKLYDDLVDDNENEIYRGPVSKFINKGYVATDYDKETETMILDWPDEIGTLPPEALQNNPQIGDYTHAPTCDFSAKQQKRITTNENEITKLNTELIKTNENINDVKNNWFNIETSPLWKKMSAFIPSSEFGKTYLAIWGYIYQPPSTPTDNYIYSNKKTIFNLSGEIERTTQKTIKLDELNVNDNVKIQLLFTKEWNDITVVSNDINYQAGSVTLYQYIGKGKPTEFIAEESTERDYYTKIETNNLLDKKQDKLIAGTNITIDENNKISATDGSSVDENRIFNNKDDKDSTTRLVTEVIKTNVGGKTLIYRNNPVITDDLDIPNKKYIDEKLKETVKKFPIAFQTYVIAFDVSTLETNNKTIAGAINENKTNIDKNFNLTIDKLEPLFDNNVFDIQENKFVVKANFITNILKSAYIKELETTNKGIVDAINELHKRVWKLEGDFVKIQKELIDDEKKIINNGNWKEVGEVITDKNNNQNFIKYIFKDKTHYRIYISYGDYTRQENNKNYSWQIINFYYQLDTSVVKSSLWIANNNNNQQTEINIYNNRIMWGMGRDYIFKRLEELQE